MNKAEIKKTILDSTGNPESGIIKDTADLIAEAIYKELNKTEVSSYKKDIETRVTKVSETR
jgi:hypothetical protein